MPRVVAPKGFFFKVQDKTYSYGYRSLQIQLWKNKVRPEQIGRITLDKEYSGCYSTHSWLNEKYQNKGFGALMYAKAIQWGLEQGYRIRSSGMSSEKALRVWRGKTLLKWFDIKVRKGRNHYSGEHDPSSDTFFPHAKKEKKKRHGNSRSSR